MYLWSLLAIITCIMSIILGLLRTQSVVSILLLIASIYTSYRSIGIIIATISWGVFFSVIFGLFSFMVSRSNPPQPCVDSVIISSMLGFIVGSLLSYIIIMTCILIHRVVIEHIIGVLVHRDLTTEMKDERTPLGVIVHRDFTTDEKDRQTPHSGG
jgi:hypothetical protein